MRAKLPFSLAVWKSCLTSDLGYCSKAGFLGNATEMICICRVLGEQTHEGGGGPTRVSGGRNFTGDGGEKEKFMLT